MHLQPMSNLKRCAALHASDWRFRPFALRPALPLNCTPRCIRVHSSAAVIPSVAEQKQFQGEMLGKMVKFMGPAVVIPLGDPLMALADTIFVGQFAGTTELAAMGPANMLFSFSLYIFHSLAMATLSLVASHLRDGERSEAARFLGCGLTLAATMGSMGACALAMGSLPLILATGVKDMALVGPASNYLSIRALALPAVLITMVAQSGKLAQHDSMTPCLSVALTVVASLVANGIFVAWMGWGLKGAAVTTVATQYLGAAVLVWALHHPTSQLKPDWTLARPDQLMLYFRTMAPLTVVSLSKNICYLIVQTTAAALATVALAAHQAAFSLWTLFTWTMGPVEQACLAYLPSAKGRWQQRATSELVLGMAFGVAVAAGVALTGLLVLGPGLLVKDLSVQPFVSLVAPQATISLLLVGVDVGATAINIALKDFRYVARSYVVTLVATTAYFAACRHQSWGLPGVWWGLVIFFGMRCVQSVARATWLVGAWPGSKQQQQHQAGQQEDDQQSGSRVIPTTSKCDLGGAGGNGNGGEGNRSSYGSDKQQQQQHQQQPEAGLDALPVPQALPTQEQEVSAMPYRQSGRSGADMGRDTAVSQEQQQQQQQQEVQAATCWQSATLATPRATRALQEERPQQQFVAAGAAAGNQQGSAPADGAAGSCTPQGTQVSSVGFGSQTTHVASGRHSQAHEERTPVQDDRYMHMPYAPAC